MVPLPNNSPLGRLGANIAWGFLAACLSFLAPAAAQEAAKSLGDDLTPEQVEIILKSGDWPLIHALAVYQNALHPESKLWKDLLESSAQRLPKVRLPQSVNLLPDAARKQYGDLFARVGKCGRLPADQQAAAAAPLLPEVKRLAATCPDFTPAWLLQAQVALLCNRPLEGRVAGGNLLALRAWESHKPEVLALLSALLLRDWLPSPRTLPEAALKELQSLLEDWRKLDADWNDAQAAALLKRIKAFNLQHPAQRYGWFVQYNLADKLARPADRTVAWSRLRPSPVPAPSAGQ